MKKRLIFIGAVGLGLSLVLLLGLIAWPDARAAAQDTKSGPRGELALQRVPESSPDESAALGSAFTYQGHLDDNGNPANASYDLRFTLFGAASGGSPVGSPITHAGVTVTDGVFAIDLDFGDNAFTGDERWLEIAAKRPADSAYTTLSPRQPLRPGPYALFAARTNWLGMTGVPGGLSDGDDDTLAELSCDSSQIAKWNGSAWACGDDQAGTGGDAHDHLGQIWTDSGDPLQINGSFGSPGYAPLALSNSHSSGDGLRITSAGRYGVFAQGGSDSDDYGGYFAGYAGIYGEGGDGFGGRFVSATNYGVYVEGGTGTAADAIRVGSAGDDGLHIWTASDNGIVVTSVGSSGVIAHGGTDSGEYGGYFTGYTGVYGQSETGEAGHFEGPVYVSGYLTKAGGGFKIDHPLDPEGKYLNHSFVESPDMKNVYDGVVILNADGAAWVDLPDWFEALNRDFRYQLTPIGAPGPNLYIAQEIQNNRFQIAGGKAGMKVSWQVTGTRHDSWAEAHRTPVEADKPPDEQGTYLHPLERDQPETMGLGYQRHQTRVEGAEAGPTVPVPPVKP